MNKDKYLKELEKRLDYLTPEQKQDEIFRISNDMDNGKVLNDLSVEIKEIYAKYNINIDKEIKKSDNKYLILLHKFSSKIEVFVKNIKKKNMKEKLTVLRDIVLITLLVSVLKIPFIAVETILFNLFGEILSYTIFNIVHFVIEIFYIIFALFTFIRIFKKRFKVELEIEND